MYGYIQAKAKSLDCPIYAVGGMADHIHLVVSIPPSRAVADFVMRIKGSSSHHSNRTVLNQTFAWQREYGAFSLGAKQLEGAIAYVEQQKQHHADQTLVARLEPELLPLQ